MRCRRTTFAAPEQDRINQKLKLVHQSGCEQLAHQIAAAVRVIVQLARMSDGKRRVMSIAELTGMEGDIIQMQEIYKYVRTGTREDGTVEGHFVATGVRPRFLADLAAKGFKLPGSYFDPSKPL